ncbi:Protein BIM1 [Vanrija pseudolonga]|uniref:Protein BIM1 n=1 Tax=Vanrija pseudolonga TaxID=143232 RepID=A0AAF0YA05_9TREE|nr:Protein BIM1 [Vanrija pseudolonga]
MSVYVGESRGELLAWLNDLLAPNVLTKVEECGKGVIYCQVLDSIYGDLPMSRVKLNAKMEYEYLENFKILQKAFAKHRIDKPIPVERLVKCKMQDNLEFLQWMKKFWDLNSSGAEYNAAARSGGVIAAAAPAPSRAPAAARPSAAAARSAAPAPRASSAGSNAQVQLLNSQVQELQATCEGLEKERDFYFAKLRSIELIVGDRINLDEVDPIERETLQKVQEILYQTEDGFEVPEGEELLEGDSHHLDDEETF